MLARIVEEALDNTNYGYVHTGARKGRFRSDPTSISEAFEGIFIVRPLWLPLEYTQVQEVLLLEKLKIRNSGPNGMVRLTL